MEAKCINNKGSYPALTIPKDATKSISNSNYVSSHEWYTIDGEMVGYPLSVGNIYKVYAILVFNDTYRFLVFDNDNLPQFYPSELFECVETSLPIDCHFCSYKAYDSMFLFIGPDCINNYQSFVDLIDLDSNAISKLIEYKCFLDEWDN